MLKASAANKGLVWQLQSVNHADSMDACFAGWVWQMRLYLEAMY